MPEPTPGTEKCHPCCHLDFPLKRKWEHLSLLKSQNQKLSSLAAAAKSLQLCPTLCDPIDGSPPGPAVPGILQARTLGWAAISSSNAWKWKVKVKLLSRVRLLATPWTAAYQPPPSMGFSLVCKKKSHGLASLGTKHGRVLTQTNLKSQNRWPKDRKAGLSSRKAANVRLVSLQCL